MVGDASQTVYSFTGADARYLLDFERTYDDARVVRLERNYRSTAPVLAVANDLMRGRAGALELKAASDDETPTPTVRAFDDDEDEAAAVARSIRDSLSRGVDPHDIAVLYRSHAQSAALLSALAKVGVAASVLGGRKFFDLPEVRQALMALRAASVAPLETGFLPTVRDVLRSVGLTDDPPRRAVPCARRGRRGRLCCGWPRRPPRVRICALSPTTCRRAPAISTSRPPAR